MIPHEQVLVNATTHLVKQCINITNNQQQQQQQGEGLQIQHQQQQQQEASSPSCPLPPSGLVLPSPGSLSAKTLAVLRGFVRLLRWQHAVRYSLLTSYSHLMWTLLPISGSYFKSWVCSACKEPAYLSVVMPAYGKDKYLQQQQQGEQQREGGQQGEEEEGEGEGRVGVSEGGLLGGGPGTDVCYCLHCAYGVIGEGRGWKGSLTAAAAAAGALGAGGGGGEGGSSGRGGSRSNSSSSGSGGGGRTTRRSEGAGAAAAAAAGGGWVLCVRQQVLEFEQWAR